MKPSLPEHEAVATEIEQARLAIEQALRLGDAAAVASAYADDATLLAPIAGIVHGRPAIERYWRTGVETGIQGLEHLGVELHRRGDVVLEMGEYVLRLSPETGTPVVDRGQYLAVHRIDGAGQWRRAAEMFSPERPPMPEPC